MAEDQIKRDVGEAIGRAKAITEMDPCELRQGFWWEQSARLMAGTLAARAVNPLEWSERPNFPAESCWWATSPLCSYAIDQEFGSDAFYYEVRRSGSLIGVFDGLPEAKEAAQADYSIGILSALTTSTAVCSAEAFDRKLERRVIPGLYLDGNRPLPFDRDTLGRFVREAWVRWSQTQPDPKSTWLVPYDDLPEADKEADRQIGETIARWALIGDAARAALKEG